VKRIESPDGSVRTEIQPEVLGETGIKKSTMDAVRSAMRDVVMSDRGTGKKARVLGVEVAGKTGTAQVVTLAGSNKKARGTRDHAWFIAFAPVENPEIAMAVLVEHAGGGGGAFAAPVAKQILTRYFSRNQGPVPEVSQQANAVRPSTPDAL
jgi:penicillin-binding protein 2